MTTTTDFQTTIAVASSPAEAFDRVCRVTGWWTTDIVGQTFCLGADFTVSFADTYVDFHISEFIPGETVSWKVMNCYLPWLADKAEWTGTTVRFDIVSTDSGSKVTLTHVGLHPGVECFEGCAAGWTHHFGESLLSLIQDGNGAPKGRQLHASIKIASTAAEAFEAICKVPEWWSTEFEGNARSLGDVFTVRFGDQHWTEFRVAEMILGQRIVWEVTDSYLESFENRTEWTGTQIIWVIQEQAGSAKLTLTHKGLDPEKGCYDSCEQGWAYFVSQSLSKLITDGKGLPGIPVATGDTNE